MSTFCGSLISPVQLMLTGITLQEPLAASLGANNMLPEHVNTNMRSHIFTRFWTNLVTQPIVPSPRFLQDAATGQAMVETCILLDSDCNPFARVTWASYAAGDLFLGSQKGIAAGTAKGLLRAWHVLQKLQPGLTGTFQSTESSSGPFNEIGIGVMCGMYRKGSVKIAGESCKRPFLRCPFQSLFLERSVRGCQLLQVLCPLCLCGSCAWLITAANDDPRQRCLKLQLHQTVQSTNLLFSRPSSSLTPLHPVLNRFLMVCASLQPIEFACIFSDCLNIGLVLPRMPTGGSTNRHTVGMWPRPHSWDRYGWV